MGVMREKEVLVREREREYVDRQSSFFAKNVKNFRACVRSFVGQKSVSPYCQKL